MNPTDNTIAQQFSEGNFGACYEYFADDIEWDIIGSKSLKGKAEVISFCEKMTIEIGSARLVNNNVIEGNDYCVIEGDCAFNDASGKAGKLSYCDVYHFKSQKIQRIHSYCIEMPVATAGN